MNNRLINLFLWDVKSHRANILKAFIAVSIFLSLANNILPLLFERNGIMIHGSNPARSMAAAMGLFAFLCYMVLAAARVLKPMSRKQERIAFLMLPATNAEKFIERVFYVIVVNILIFVLGFLTADVVQFLFSFILTPGYHHFVMGVIPYEFGYIFLNNGDIISLFLLIFFFLWQHSFYVLGGTLFRRSPMLFTACLEFLLFTFFFSVNAGVRFGNDDVLFFCVFFLIATVFDYSLAYRLFTRSQLVTRKWFNV